MIFLDILRFVRKETYPSSQQKRENCIEQYILASNLYMCEKKDTVQITKISNNDY